MLRFHNTLSGRVEPFEPLRPGQVGLYTCGPTVYDHAHIGNFRAYVWEDLLRRTLERRGFTVLHVMNLTDVDDKTIRNSRERGITLDAYTQPYIDGFFEDVRTLNLLPAHHYPRATRHVDEMVILVERLRAAGNTYESQESIYFRIDSFPSYGRLSRLDPGQMQVGERVDSDEYEKEDVRDFVLWKAQSEEPAWETRLGRGRPGWHLECSAMSMKYLGEAFDLHTGAVDNIFPHHENEIAQSEAATGVPFVKYWMHCAHLIVDGKKMSKSAGNFFTLRDLLDRGLSPRAIRYLLQSVHYRKPLNFTLEGVEQARAALDRLDAFRHRLEHEPASAGRSPLAGQVEATRARFDAALDDDLNSAEALGVLFELIREANSAYDRGEVRADDRVPLAALLDEVDAVFGLATGNSRLLDADVEALLKERQAAREARDYARADALRDTLAERGIVLEDTPHGMRWRRR